MRKSLMMVSYLKSKNFDLHLIEIWESIFVIFLVWLALVILIVISRQTKQIKLRRQIRVQRLARTYLSVEIFEDSAQLSIAEKRAQSNFVRNHLHNSKGRKIFLNILTDFKMSFTGEVSEKIKQIYVKYGFSKHSFKKTFNFNYLKIIEGLRELSIMEGTNSINLANKFVKNANISLRGEAQISIISIKGYEGLSIFNDFNESLPTWQQIRIINVLESFIKPDKFDYHELLENPNPDVILLALRIINNFKFYEAIAIAINFRGHPNVKIRMEVAIIIKNFYNPSYNRLLRDWFEREDYLEVKIYLLEATDTLGALEMLLTLIKQMNEYPSKRIGIASAKVFKNLCNTHPNVGLTRAILNEEALKLLKSVQNDMIPVN